MTLLVPSDLSGISWFDFTDSSKTTLSGSNITAVAAKGVTATLTEAATASVIVAASNINSERAGRFSEASRLSYTPSAMPEVLFGVYYLVNPNSQGGFVGLIGGRRVSQTNPNNPFYLQIDRSGTGQGIFYSENPTTSGTDVETYTGTTLNNQAVVIAVRRIPSGGGTLDMWVNGTKYSGNTTRYTHSDLVEIMVGVNYYNGAYGNWFKGDLTDVGWGSSNLSDADIDKLVGSLAWKHGLQGNLPVGHTYKSAAPTITSTVYTLTAAVTAIPLTKRSANLTFSRALPAVKKTISITKRASNLIYARIMPAAKKTITITKQAAILTHGWSMPAVKKSVPITKQVTNLIMARRLAASLKSVPITKRSANLVMGYRLVAAPKSVPITKQPATLTYNTSKTMQAAFRTIPITKYPVGLILVPVGGISSGGNHSMKIAVQGKK